MATINDLPKVEGIRDFFRAEIYGRISDKLYVMGVFGDREDPLYQECLWILGEAASLVDIVLDETLTPAEKDLRIEVKLQELYRRLADLRAVLGLA